MTRGFQAKFDLEYATRIVDSLISNLDSDNAMAAQYKYDALKGVGLSVAGRLPRINTGIEVEGKTSRVFEVDLSGTLMARNHAYDMSGLALNVGWVRDILDPDNKSRGFLDGSLYVIHTSRDGSTNWFPAYVIWDAQNDVYKVERVSFDMAYSIAPAHMRAARDLPSMARYRLWVGRGDKLRALLGDVS